MAGEVRLEAAVRLTERVLRLVFRVDELPVDTVPAPPWRGVWSSQAPPGGALRTLRIEGRTAAGEIVRSAPLPVWVLPDSAPRVAILNVGGALWLERRATASLLARAFDPEEGDLPPERIRWTGERLRRPLTGERLPLLLLPEGIQQIRAEAFDQWERLGSSSIRVTLFTYRPANEPQDCLWNLTAALRARDPDAWGTGLDPRFRFVPCSSEVEAAGWQTVWEGSVFLSRLARWLRDPSLQSLDVAGPPDLAWTWDSEIGQQAWCPIPALELRFSLPAAARRDPAEDEEGDERDGWRGDVVIQTGAQVLLVRPPGEPWRVLEWRDLPAQMGRSLASLLARAEGLPLPRPGPGCRPRPAPWSPRPTSPTPRG